MREFQPRPVLASAEIGGGRGIKKADLILFSTVLSLMEEGKHLTVDGVKDILSNTVCMNKGRPPRTPLIIMGGGGGGSPLFSAEAKLG